MAGALDRNREQLKDLITNFRVTAGAFARENANLEAAIAELPRTLRAAQPALAALNRSFPGLRGFARDIRPGVENSEETIDVSLPLLKQLRGLVSQPELRGLTADLRPTVPALASFANESVPLSKQVRQAVELPDRGHPAVEQGQARRREVPVDRPGLPGAAQAVPAASPARAAPATPTASGSACSPPAARTS